MAETGGSSSPRSALSLGQRNASIRVTLDLYGRLYPDANRTVLRELDRLIDPPGLEL
jgi:hypothetical protein